MVAMGNNGVEEQAREILHKIHAERKDASHRFHFIFICGKNKPFALELKKFVKKNSFDDSLITVSIEKHLNEEEMAKRAKAADVWIAKMGGSTSAEALQMKKYVLSVSLENHPWEHKNAQANREFGLSAPFDKKRKVLPQVHRPWYIPTREVPDWGQQMMQIIHSELGLEA